MCNVYSGERVAVNLRREVYSYGIQTAADETSWNIVWDRYISSSTSAREKDDLLYSLCQTTDLTLIHKSVQNFFRNAQYTDNSNLARVWK